MQTLEKVARDKPQTKVAGLSKMPNSRIHCMT